MAAPMAYVASTASAAFSSKFCAMHVDLNAKDKFIVFNKESWNRYIEFCGKWLDYECIESDIVTENASKLGLDFRNRDDCIAAYPSPSRKIGYHYKCYKRFCDISKVKRKRKSLEKKLANKDTETTEPCVPEAEDIAGPSRKQAEVGKQSLDTETTGTIAPQDVSGPSKNRSRHSIGKRKHSMVGYSIPTTTGHPIKKRRRLSLELGTDMEELDDSPIRVDSSSKERVLRSDFKVSQRDPSKRHMFPNACILCQSNRSCNW